MRHTAVNGYGNRSSEDKEGANEAILFGEKEDVVQKAIGNMGKWQTYVCLAISLIKFPVAWHQLAIVFMAAPQQYNCTAPGRIESEDECFVKVNGSDVECSQWEYDRSAFRETIVSQWNLVCERAHYVNLQQSILMLGILLGNIIFGSLADRYGRKMPLMMAVVLQLASGVGCAVVPCFPGLLMMKLVSALATGGTMITSFVICMEIVGIEWRAAITVLYQIPYSLGHLSLAGLAYEFRHWQHLQLAISLPSIVLLGYWWIVPESPRWLMALGREKAACEVLRRAAHVNGMESKDIAEAVRRHCQRQVSSPGPDKRGTLLDLFRTPNMRRKSFSIFFNWLVCGMGLFGMCQYIGRVGGDIFLNFAVSGVIQVPGNLVAWWAMNALGRRITLIGCNSVAGLSSILLVFVADDVAWLRLVLVSLAIVGMSVSFTTVYLFSGELFPTVVRNVGVGASSMCARIGSIVAPFIVSLVHLQAWLPLVVFGTLPLIAAALCLLLPETAGCKLPETLQDGEEFGKKRQRTRKPPRSSPTEAELSL